MRSIILSFCLLFVSPIFAMSPPDEGMWLPMLLKDYNYEEMQRLGCKLTPEQIYSINNASVKDAIVQLGGFCTAEVISNEGLIITNHHCAYDAIASQSSEEHNYLKDGFWAKNKEAELKIEGLSVTFLVRMEDVSEELRNIQMTSVSERADMAVMERIAEIEAEASEDGKYVTSVKDMFNGNAHYLFVYEVYEDIRLVGAPPSSIGKFGGDTDNWMWPRHTGDFSLLRIYADKDNKPASYTANNRPHQPKHFLPVSGQGLSEGDFTMVMGYPGSTDRYLTSFELNNLQQNEAPLIVDLLDKRLKIMKSEMDKSERIAIEFASSRASLANTYKYYKGQLRGLKKFDLLGQKQKYEAGIAKWVSADDSRKEKYGSLLADFEKLFGQYGMLIRDQSILNIAAFAPELIGPGIAAYRLSNILEMDNEARTHATLDMLEEQVRAYIQKDAMEMDRQMLIFALDAMQNDLSSERPFDVFFENPMYTKKAKGSNERFADLVFEKSILTNEKRLNKFLKKPSLKVMEKDPGVFYILSLIDYFRSEIQSSQAVFSNDLADLRKSYLALLQEKETDKVFYPDANFTMRVTYGTVQNYDSWEGKEYETFTYGSQILDKYKAGDEEFDVPEKLRTLLKNKDYGNYADANGKLPVCFLHNTDITGGNSGSPVINGEGHLVGVAFDGNWESMTSDLFWQDDYVRTISVDIRYVLFIIDKFAGASHIIDELEIVQ
ncbi:MAG: S46 family peptidase [Crocinitomicaceae bacterium]